MVVAVLLEERLVDREEKGDGARGREVEAGAEAGGPQVAAA